MWCLVAVWAFFVQYVVAQTSSVVRTSSLSTPSPFVSNSSVTTGLCTGCLLEALNPYTIPDPTAFSNHNSTTVITTAIVIRSTTFFDPTTPVASEVNYYTRKITTTVPLPTENGTTYSTLSTSTFTYDGVVLTWPTQYVSYSAFATASQCSGSATEVALPEATDAAKLIYPLVDGSGLPLELVEYLETLPEFADVDLVNCSSLALSKDATQRLFGRFPLPVGSRKHALQHAKREINGTMTTSTTSTPPAYQTSDVLTSSIATSSSTTGIADGYATPSPYAPSTSAPLSSTGPGSYPLTSSNPTPTSTISSSSSSRPIGSGSVPSGTGNSYGNPDTSAKVISSTGGHVVSGSGMMLSSSVGSVAPWSTPASDYISQTTAKLPLSVPLTTGSSRTIASIIGTLSTGGTWSRTGDSSYGSASTPNVGNHSQYLPSGAVPPTITGTAGISGTGRHSAWTANGTVSTICTTHVEPNNITTRICHTTTIGFQGLPTTTLCLGDECGSSLATTTTQTAAGAGSGSGPGVGPHNPSRPHGGNPPEVLPPPPLSSPGEPDTTGCEPCTIPLTEATPGTSFFGSPEATLTTQTIANIKTSVAVLTQITTDASTTVKAPGTISKPVPQRTSAQDPTPSGNQDNPSGGGGGSSGDVPASPGDGDTQVAGSSPSVDGSGLASVIVSVAGVEASKSAAAAGAQATHGDGGSGGSSTGGGSSGSSDSDGSNDTNGSSSSNGGAGEGTGSQTGSSGSSGQSDGQGSTGSDGSNSEQPDGGSDGSTGTGSSDTNGQSGEGDSGDESNSSGDSGSEGAGSGNTSGGSSDQGSGNAGPAAAQKPAQTVNIAGTPVTVHALPTATTNGQGSQSIGEEGASTSSDGTGSGGDVVIGGNTLQPGQVATINSVPVSVAGDGSNVVVGGTQTIGIGDSTQTVKIGGTPEPIAAGAPSNGNGAGANVVVGSTTLSPGQSGTVNGVSVSVAKGGSALVIGGTSTVNIGQGTQSVNIGGTPEAVAPSPSKGDSGVVVDGTTIEPGQTATINGVHVSLAGSGSNLVVGGTKTIPLGSSPQTIDVGGKQEVVSAAGQTPAAGSGGVELDGTTILPGQFVTIHGVAVSLEAGGSSLVIGGSKTVAVQRPGTTAPVIQFGGSTITAEPDGDFVIGGQTLRPGSSPITVSGTTIGLNSNGEVVTINGKTSHLDGLVAGPTGLPVLTLGSQTVTANVAGSSTEFIIGPGETLTPGGSIVISGTMISLPAGTPASVVVINGHTSTLGSSIPIITAAPVLTVGGIPYTALTSGTNTEFIIASGETLSKGGTLVLSGTTYSWPASGSASVVVVDGHSSTLGTAALSAAPVLTVDGTAYTASTSGSITDFIIGTQTLSRGGTVTIDGTTYSYPATGAGSIVVVNGKTSSLGHAYVTGAPDLTIDGTTYAPVTKGTSTFYVVDGSTLLPGSTINLHGTKISLGQWESILVVGTKTTTLKGPATVDATATSAADSLASATGATGGGSNGGSSTASSTHSGGARRLSGLESGCFLAALLWSLVLLV